MDQKNFAIGILSTTAAIMLVGLLIITARPTPAIASGMTASGGDYVMTVGTTPQTDEEFVYVVSNSAKKMIVYRFDTTRGLLDLAHVVDLSSLHQAGQQPAPTKRRP